MKKILVLSAFAFVAQNAFAEDAKTEKTYSLYGSAYGTYFLLDSREATSRDAMGLDIREVRLGVKGNFGVIKSDFEFDLLNNTRGNGGPDWDNNQVAIDVEPQTAGANPSADKLYKSIWNVPVRKAYAEVAVPTGGALQVGILRPAGGTSNGLYMATGLEAYDSVMGVSYAQPMDVGPAKLTVALTAMNKLHAENAAYEVASVGKYKAMLVSVAGTVGDATNFAFAYGSDFGSSVAGGAAEKSVAHIEASASHKVDKLLAGLWYQNEAYRIRYTKVEGSKIKLGGDVRYGLSTEIEGVATYVYRLGGGTDAAGTETKDKSIQEIWVGPNYQKNGIDLQAAAVFAMSEDKIFAKDGKPADSKNLLVAMLTAGYKF